MGRVFDFVMMTAIPTIFVGIPAVLFVISENCEAFGNFADKIGRDL